MTADRIDVLGQPVEGIGVAPAAIAAALEPERVLYEFDGPRIFTCRDSAGGLLLCYQCDEAAGRLAHVVAPVRPETVDELERGSLTVQQALDQPRIYLVEGGEDYTIARGVLLPSIDALPAGGRPLPGVMLWPELQPVFGLRAVGPDLAAGETRLSVAKQVFDSAEKALKALAGYVLDIPAKPGSPPAALRSLYDFPTTRVAFGSFQLELGLPPMLDGRERIVQGGRLSEMHDLLSDALRWLDGPTDEPPDPQNARRRDVLLRCLGHLTPPLRGPIREMFVYGQLVGTPLERRSLSRDATLRVRAVRSANPDESDQFVSESGYIRGVDRDRLTVILRPQEGGEEATFTFEPEFEDDVLEAFNSETRISVVAVREGGAAHPNLLGILPEKRPATDTPAAP